MNWEEVKRQYSTKEEIAENKRMVKSETNVCDQKKGRKKQVHRAVNLVICSVRRA